jgi:hypothetical protein
MKISEKSKKLRKKVKLKLPYREIEYRLVIRALGLSNMQEALVN